MVDRDAPPLPSREGDCVVDRAASPLPSREGSCKVVWAHFLFHRGEDCLARDREAVFSSRVANRLRCLCVAQQGLTQRDR